LKPESPALLRHYIGGEFVASAATFDNIAPVDGRLLSRVSEADRATVESAVAAARALSGPGAR
jgi:aminomuconate-semialdehyde/2-hydroxymuconate-6-semialdehyde dehydrogenase